MQFDLINTIIFLFITLLAFGLILLNKQYSSSKKVFFIFTSFGILFYSGISTLYIGLCEEYFWLFIFYYISFVFGFSVCSRLHLDIKRKRIIFTKRQKKNDCFSAYSYSEKYISNNFLKLMVCIYISYYIVQLCYPVFRISNLFHFNFSLTDSFSGVYKGGGAVYQIFYYLNLGTTCFFYIYMYRLIKENRIIRAVLLFGFSVYLEVAASQYMARSGALAKLLFLMLLLVSRYREKVRMRKILKILIVFGGFFICITPMLVAYEKIRLGASASIVSVPEAIEQLFYSETCFGKYYSVCEEHYVSNNLLGYILWFITLPLPSVIFTFKNTFFNVNTAFSEIVLGISSTDPGYYVLLPSLFGESLLVFGKIMCFLHGLLIGIFVYKFCNALEKNRELILVIMYFATQFLLIGRGGSASAVAPAVNIMIFYLIIVYIHKCLKMHKLKSDIREKR